MLKFVLKYGTFEPEPYSTARHEWKNHEIPFEADSDEDAIGIAESRAHTGNERNHKLYRIEHDDHLTLLWEDPCKH